MEDVEKVTKNTISDGGVLALLYFDVHGTSEDVVKNIATGFVQKLIKEKDVVYAYGEIDVPIKDNEMYSTSLEVKVLTKNFMALAAICSAYSPFSIEILKPDRFNFTIDQIHDILIFLSSSSLQFKKFILEKISTKEEIESYKRSLQNKAKVGERLLKKKEK
ncbi:hypothetical protein JXB01_02435 [Candidatus Micrarchaeota archaeon]|nr:hypothetical protein [Candidatus Micrarchaeota archaeon]